MTSRNLPRIKIYRKQLKESVYLPDPLRTAVKMQKKKFRKIKKQIAEENEKSRKTDDTKSVPEKRKTARDEDTTKKDPPPAASQMKDPPPAASQMRDPSGAAKVPEKEAKLMKKLVFEFVKRTFEKNAKGLQEEFIAMKRINDFDKMKVFLANNTKGKNRYKDVGCLDNTRVKLRDFGENDYIHANYVRTPQSDKRFICTQAPLEKTAPEFWHMIVQEEVENIIMLCNFFEKGAKKCFEYFPTEKDDDLTIGDFTIKCIDRSDFKFSCSTKTELKVTLLEVECGGKTQKLTHYHWVDWPDRSVPATDMAIIELLKTLSATRTPIIVHCSAGIGRTGSVVLIQYIMEMVQAGQSVEDCAVLLKELRTQRANSVQTFDQYAFVHMVLINYWLEAKVLDKSAEKHLQNMNKKLFPTKKNESENEKATNK